MKPFSQACENNKQPILEALKPAFAGCHTILEIGSGTGQHAVFFARYLPHLYWQTSDQVHYHDGIHQWIAESGLENIGLPIALDVSEDTWPTADFDGVFSANTCHIMSWSDVGAMFKGVSELLPPGGCFCLYGPFNRNGEFTSQGNARFHDSLVRQDPKMGIRDDEAIFGLAEEHGLGLGSDLNMPANNRLLVMEKMAIS